MSRILQVFYVILSAAALSLGIPNEIYNLGSPFFGFLALIPLYFVYSSCTSYKTFALCMGLHAGLVHLLSSFWLAFFKDFAALTLGASAAGTAVISLLCGLFFFIPFSKTNGPSTAKAQFLINDSWYTSKKILWFPLCYVTWEWVKSTGFLAYPWGTLYQTTYHIKIFTQIADITGVYGISFLIALFAALCAEGILLYFKQEPEYTKLRHTESYIYTAMTAGVLFLLTFAYGTFQYLLPRKPEKLVNTIMVQQNADPWKVASDDETILVSERLTKNKINEAKSKGHNVDLIVWSEGCLKYRFPRAESHYTYFPREKPLIPFIKETKIPFLLGGSYAPAGTSSHFNGALLFDSEGHFRGAYPKNHLVPLAESVPFTDIKPVADFFKNIIGISAGWTPGNKYTMFSIPCRYPPERLPEVTNVISLKETFSDSKNTQKPFVQFSAPICFDDAFPDVCRPLVKYGSEFFMNITDDSWSMKKSSEYQHFVVSYFRAIEHRTTLARSTNSGYSAVIDPSGRIIMDMPLFEEAAEFVQIPVYRKSNTVYQTLGNWLPVLSFITILLSIAYEIITQNKPLTVKSERNKLSKHKKHKKRK